MRRNVLLVLLLWALLVLPAIFARGYWNPDEGRYAAVAREVWRGDGAVIPRLNGEIYAEKPPLFFWLTAGCQSLTGGVSAAASRLPSAFSTLCAALFLLGLVRRTHGEKEGTVAAAVFLTSAMVVQLAGWVAIDPLVTCLVTGCLYFQERAFTASRWRALPVAAVYLLLAAIVLSKGAPLAIALIALGGAAWLRGGLRSLLHRHMLWGLPLMLLLIAAWALLVAGDAGWSHLRQLTIEQVDRRVVGSDSHQRPVFYYLLRFPAFFFPWVLLLPAVVRRTVLDWRRGGEERRRTGLYMLWFLVPFVLFSLVSGKRERYILPLFPAAAALTGIALVRLEPGRWFRRLVRMPMFVTLGVLGVLGLVLVAAVWGLPGIIRLRLDYSPASQVMEAEMAFSAGRLALLAGGLSALLVVIEALVRRRDRVPVVPICAATASIVLALVAGVLPVLDRFKSYDPLARTAEARCDPNARWMLLGLRPGPFCVVMDRHDFTVLRETDRMERAVELLSGGEPWVVVTPEKTLRHLSQLVENERLLLPRVVRSIGRRTIHVVEVR